MANSANKTDFVVKLPTTLVAYADLKLISKLYISGYIQQKLSDDSDNDQITSHDYITITPRINLGFLKPMYHYLIAKYLVLMLVLVLDLVVFT